MTIVLFATLVWQVVDFLRELTNWPTSKSSALTQVAAWVAGIAVVFIAAHAAVTQNLVLPGVDLAVGDYDVGSIVLVGMLAASLASSIVDVKQAVDGNDSSRKPPLLTP